MGKGRPELRRSKTLTRVAGCLEMRIFSHHPLNPANRHLFVDLAPLMPIVRPAERDAFRLICAML